MPYEPEPGESIDIEALRRDFRRMSALPVSLNAGSYSPMEALDEAMRSDLEAVAVDESQALALAALTERNGARSAMCYDDPVFRKL